MAIQYRLLPSHYLPLLDAAIPITYPDRFNIAKGTCKSLGILVTYKGCCHSDLGMTLCFRHPCTQIPWLVFKWGLINDFTWSFQFHAFSVLSAQNTESVKLGH